MAGLPHITMRVGSSYGYKQEDQENTSSTVPENARILYSIICIISLGGKMVPN